MMTKSISTMAITLKAELGASGVQGARWRPTPTTRNRRGSPQAACRRINLRWHEYASRLVEEGVPLAQVPDLLGHASTTTTERYDNQRLETLQLAVTKLERGGRFSGSPRARLEAQGPRLRVG
jgi:hypothetical protein